MTQPHKPASSARYHWVTVPDMSPQQQRAHDAREKKLAEMREQIDNGSLTVREMTPEERKKYPKPDENVQRSRSKRRR